MRWHQVLLVPERLNIIVRTVEDGHTGLPPVLTSTTVAFVLWRVRVLTGFGCRSVLIVSGG
jgi:hypothetical protein